MSTDQELLYEVDEFDVVIGPRARGEIHRLGLRHRAVHILVFNREGKLFLQKRSMRKDVNPGAWDTSAAGHVDFGESYEEAAYREVQEEIGIEVPASALQLIGTLPASEVTGMEFIQIYRFSHDGPFRLHPEEIDDGGWFDPAEIDRWIAAGAKELTRSFSLIWKTVRSDEKESNP